MNRNRFLITTVNIWGEGDREESFLKYLYRLYHVRDRRVVIHNAHGGDPVAQIQQMINYYMMYDFDEKYALFDLDRGEKSVTKARELAVRNGIVCIESNRCLEMELVRILVSDAKMLKKAGQSSDEAKKVFAKLCRLKNVDDGVEWERWIKKGYLDRILLKNDWLKYLISGLIEGRSER